MTLGPHREMTPTGALLSHLIGLLGTLPSGRPNASGLRIASVLLDSYIADWLRVLKDDKRAIFTAASHASKATEYLHGLQPQPAA